MYQPVSCMNMTFVLNSDTTYLLLLINLLTKYCSWCHKNQLKAIEYQTHLACFD